MCACEVEVLQPPLLLLPELQQAARFGPMRQPMRMLWGPCALALNIKEAYDVTRTPGYVVRGVLCVCVLSYKGGVHG